MAYAFIAARKRRAGSAPLTVSAPMRLGFSGGLAALLGRGSLNDGFWSELESALISADAGLPVTQYLMASVKSQSTPAEVRRMLADEMIGMLRKGRALEQGRPHVVVVLGVNGVGKTTTIAKLARAHIDEGRRVLLVACDTFRAAATEQLAEWAKRLGCEIVSQQPGADPASVAYDGVARAAARGHEVVIIDTAGRLHTKQNLMEELKKISRVTGKACLGAPHEKIVVIDGTVGGNGLAQAREFHAAVGLTGAVVTKLDGTAKGGVLLAISRELGIPITHVGVGEGIRDLKPFDAREFVDSIIA